MRIFAISIVKNEVDIIEDNLLSASKWADKIFVLDNGSTDGTWEVVKSLANDTICPWKQVFAPFHDSFRSLVYNNFRFHASPGDWWCFRLDADEFYSVCPKKFLDIVPNFYGQVYKRSLDFVLTRNSSCLGISKYDKFDRSLYRYIKKMAWCELRFFKESTRVVWHSQDVAPSHLKAIYPNKINVLHYQFRSLEQLLVRLEVRLDSKQRSIGSGKEFLWDHVEDKPAISYVSDLNNVLEYDSAGSYIGIPEINGRPYRSLLHKWYWIFKSCLNLE